MKTLFKKSTTGKILVWRCWASGNMVMTSHGEMNGTIQTNSYKAFPKYIGKKNETTAFEQAEVEVKAHYTKKLKAGYVDDLIKAQKGEQDEIIKGGIKPMLAHKFSEHKDKITYPAFVQPKLDGIRCIAHVKKGNVTLWSRTQKEFSREATKHIIDELKTVATKYKYLLGDEFYLDGELYNHKWRANFSEIASLAAKKKLTMADRANAINLQFHVYDVIQPSENFSFKHRDDLLVETFLTETMNADNKQRFAHVVRVPCRAVLSEDQVFRWTERFIGKGFEGAMVRDWHTPYECKRSYSLQKVKMFLDAEYTIIGFELSKDGKKVIAQLVTQDGQRFGATMEGSEQDNIKKYWNNKKKWVGQMLTVRFQALTEYGVPRFPVGVSVRDYE